MFATEIVNLGSVFDCDWQGIPKISDLLIPTTYKIPPDTEEFDETNTIVETCGMVKINSSSSLFFSVNCVGIDVTYGGCLNLRHICEKNIDETDFDVAGNVIRASDCIIGSNDIDSDSKWFRDVFYGSNKYTSTPWIGLDNLTIPSNGYTTNFNTKHIP
jgi:hypothetical protein